MKKYAIALVAPILCVASFYFGRSCRPGSVIPDSKYEVVDIITTDATLSDLAPAIRDSVVIRYQYETIPVTPPPEPGDTAVIPLPPPDNVTVVEYGDSAEIIIPILQKVFEGENYRAYISGYRATMDSIFVKQRTNTIHIREPTKQKRFSIGLQAGYGMTPKGFQPYVGIGVSVNLWTF